MRATLIGIGLGLAGFVIACEALFRVLPVSTATMTGYTIDPAILTYPPHHSWTMATGWDLRNPQRMHSNNLGFASDREFVPDPRAVALIGDSYVESSMLPAPDRPGAQLERLLGGQRPVYAMGGPGSSLLDYAERVRYAYQQLGVRDFVVLIEAGDIRQSVCDSGNVHAVCLTPGDLTLRVQTLPPPSMLKAVLRHSSLAQYIVGQLKAQPGLLWRSALTRKAPVQAQHGPDAGAVPPAEPDRISAASARMVDAVTEAFVARLKDAAPDARVVLVADGRRTPDQPMPPGLALERRRFLDDIAKRQLTVVDGEPLCARHSAASPLSLSVGPYDGHLNAIGVELLMTAAALSLR